MRFHNKLIDFFKKHNLYDKEMFDYLSSNTTMVDYDDPDQRVFIGTFFEINKSTNKLVKIHLNLPWVYDDKTMLICIHEIVHGLLLYKKLHKKINLGIDYEALPMLYEKLYINEKNNPELIKYGEWLDSLIRTKDIEYVFGLNIRDELLNSYNYNIDEMNILVKKLAKRYNK